MFFQNVRKLYKRNPFYIGWDILYAITNPYLFWCFSFIRIERVSWLFMFLFLWVLIGLRFVWMWGTMKTYFRKHSNPTLKDYCYLFYDIKFYWWHMLIGLPTIMLSILGVIVKVNVLFNSVWGKERSLGGPPSDFEYLLGWILVLLIPLGIMFLIVRPFLKVQRFVKSPHEKTAR